MSEWKKVKLGDCIKEINEKTTKNNQYKVLSVTKDGIFSQEEFFKKQIASKNNIGYKIIRKNNLVFSTMNLWMGSLDVLTNYDIGIVSPSYKTFEFNEKLMLPEYGNYFMKSYYMLEQYKNYSEQGASVVRRNLDLKALLKVEINIPSIKEQVEIVRIMKKVSEIIQNLDEFIKKNKKSKREIFNEIYFNKSKTGWNISKLDELGKFYKGNGISKSDICSKGKKCILYGELYTTYAEVAYEIFSKTNIILENPIYSKKWDVLIPSSGETDVDISTATCVLEDGILLGGDLNIFRPCLEKVNGEFLSYVINYAQKFEIAKYAQGVSIVHLYSEHLKKLIIEYPSIEEQLKIINVLNKINKENELLIQKKHAYENIRKGLMQRLLTGKVKVNV